MTTPDPGVPESPVTEPVPTEPPVAPPLPVAAGNKLGFYLHNSTDQHNLWEAIRRVQPPVILIHADTANRMLLEEIRNFRAPDAFVIGRMYKNGDLQRQMIDNDNPEAHGALATRSWHTISAWLPSRAPMAACSSTPG